MPHFTDQIAQAQIAATPTSVFTSAGEEVNVRQINLYNFGTNKEIVKMYHDKNGSTFDNTTIVDSWDLKPGQKVRATDVHFYQPASSNGQFAFESTNAASVNVTLYALNES